MTTFDANLWGVVDWTGWSETSKQSGIELGEAPLRVARSNVVAPTSGSGVPNAESFENAGWG